jgi:hypothetical protein
MGRINGKLNCFLSVRKSSSWTIFENKQLAIGNWQLARKNQPLSVATLCRPNSKNEKTGLKLGQIGTVKKGKKGFDRSVTARSNCTLAFVFNKGLWGVGVVAEGRRQRAARIARDRA